MAVRIEFALLSLVFVPFLVSAGRITTDLRDDPFSAGSCEVPRVLSVDHEAAERDRSFGLLFHEVVVVFCQESGYISLLDDFDIMDEDERQRVKQFLNKFRSIVDPASVSHEGRSWLLEQIYFVRERAPEFSFRLQAILHARRARFESMAYYSLFQAYERNVRALKGSPVANYIMARLYARNRLLPEACEALFRGDVSDVDSDLLFPAGNVPALREMAVNEIGKALDISGCEETRSRSEFIPNLTRGEE